MRIFLEKFFNLYFMVRTIPVSLTDWLWLKFLKLSPSPSSVRASTIWGHFADAAIFYFSQIKLIFLISNPNYFSRVDFAVNSHRMSKRVGIWERWLAERRAGFSTSRKFQTGKKERKWPTKKWTSEKLFKTYRYCSLTDP